MKDKARAKIEKKLNDLIHSDKKIHEAQLLIHSNKLDIHWKMVANKTKTDVNADQLFHTASIGKMFTAVIIAKLMEEGKLKFEDPIVNYLDKDLCEGLHVYKGKDYTNDIQIQHLLGQTSGLPDFFEEKPSEGKTFMDLALEEPSRFWTPQETIEWSKKQLTPHFEPGKRCYYTDTGYNLLGLIIEKVLSKPYDEVLHEYIFNPLNMDHTYLSQFSTPNTSSEDPISDVYLDEKRVVVEEHRSFSSFYAGGQTVSTTEDLYKFMKALVEEDFIQPGTLNKMQQWKRLWGIGIYYGLGFMNVRTLPAKKYQGWGHLGSTASFSLYYPELDAYVIGSLNQSKRVPKSMRLVLNVLQTISKIKD